MDQLKTYLDRYFFEDTLYYLVISTPVGKATAVATNEFLVYLEVGEVSIDSKWIHKRIPILVQLEKEMKDYFDGVHDSFTINIKVEGTLFQKKVYQAIRKVPFKTTVSYQDIATRINHPRSARAVGSACRQCPIAFVIPCHRVISKSGDMGGFGHSMDIKARLLLHEEQ